MIRQTGRTTRQLQEAPKGSIFIWINWSIWYPRAIARELGREDIEMVGREWIKSDRWRGRTFSGVIVDHYLAEQLTIEERKKLLEIQTRIRKI